MFNVIFGFHRNEKVHPFTVCIEGCPENGLAAVDFRKKYGLSQAPNNKIELPGRIFQSESVCRQFKTNNDADVALEYWSQIDWRVNLLTFATVSYSNTLENGFYLSPKVIKEYLENDCIHCGVNLLKDITNYTSRRKKKAEREATKKRVA